MQRDKALQSEQMRRHELVTTIVGMVLLVFCGLSFWLFRNIQAKERAYLLLGRQKKLVEIKNQQVSDSLRYAKRIQEALFPPNLFEADEDGDHFVFHMPKDVVSGDFYWRFRLDDEFL
jgi:hypothetical protein